MFGRIVVKKVRKSLHAHNAQKIKFLAGVDKRNAAKGSGDLIDLLFKKRM